MKKIYYCFFIFCVYLRQVVKNAHEIILRVKVVQ